MNLYNNLKNKVYLGLILVLGLTPVHVSSETWDPKSGLTIPLLEMPSTLGLASKDKRAIMMGFECCWDQKHIEAVQKEHSLKLIGLKLKENQKKLPSIPLFEPDKTDIYVWYILNALDVYTTYDGLRSSDDIMELNPLLGERPSLSRILAFKYIANYYIDPHQLNYDDPRLLKELNLVLSLVVLNNRYVKNTIK